MEKNKIKKLEERGWKVGSAEDFLKLTESEINLLETRLELSSYLRTIRTEKRITQVQLAKKIHSSQSRIAKMESGDPSVSLDLLYKTIYSLGKTPKEVAKFIVAY